MNSKLEGSTVGKGFMKHLKYFVISSLAMVLVHYLIPYTVLHHVRDFSLFMYWALLVLVWIVITSIIIEKWWFK